MKKNIDAFDYAGYICKAMKKGILLTTKAGDRVNTMTIGWGKIGIEWKMEGCCIGRTNSKPFRGCRRYGTRGKN